jgi:intraflagellar transport protein 122
VYCVAYATDGSRFASGGADKTVIIWSSVGQGLLKYTHSSPIQALAYNPVTQHLASGSENDVGLWSPELKSVPKKSVTSCVRCLAWTEDGQQLAVGLEDGRVLIRDKAGEHRSEFQPSSTPVWSLAFKPACAAASNTAQLVVASWNGALFFCDVRLET